MLSFTRVKMPNSRRVLSTNMNNCFVSDGKNIRYLKSLYTDENMNSYLKDQSLSGTLAITFIYYLCIYIILHIIMYYLCIYILIMLYSVIN